MSSYACPGCGEDAPLSQECPTCEAQPRGEWRDFLQAFLRAERRMVATRDALCALMTSHATALNDLLAAREDLEVARNAETYLRAREHDLQGELEAQHARNRDETQHQRRARHEVLVLRERLAEYERPVDDKALAEVIYRVEVSHAAFHHAERDGALVGGSWCEDCEGFIGVIRKLMAERLRQERAA